MKSAESRVTEAAQAIKRREDGQKRITKIAVPLLGVIMAVSAVTGCCMIPVSGWRLAVMIASAAFYLLSCSSLVSTWTIGMIPQAGIGAYFFCAAALLPPVAQYGPLWLKIAAGIVFGAAGVIVLYIFSVLAVMLFGSIAPRARGEYTLLVLGSKLKNGKPGRMLRRRLDKAASELKKHPGLMCVVTGGRAPDQPCAEADAMREYLLEKGVDAERVIVENLSSTTYENFLFSRKIIEEKGLPVRAGVVTDRFHQFRSGRIARTARMDSFPVSCGTAWYFSVQFWMRDMLCITERLIRGHW
ncbi:MAG: YdcF family protein [Ruminococcaceae bacterium]|nr:YdcF family protein [Oscillospiraceae bacterium]